MLRVATDFWYRICQIQLYALTAPCDPLPLAWDVQGVGCQCGRPGQGGDECDIAEPRPGAQVLRLCGSGWSMVATDLHACGVSGGFGPVHSTCADLVLIDLVLHTFPMVSRVARTLCITPLHLCWHAQSACPKCSNCQMSCFKKCGDTDLQLDLGRACRHME